MVEMPKNTNPPKPIEKTRTNPVLLFKEPIEEQWWVHHRGFSTSEEIG
jgi:hypothetical protein